MLKKVSVVTSKKALAINIILGIIGFGLTHLNEHTNFKHNPTIAGMLFLILSGIWLNNAFHFKKKGRKNVFIGYLIAFVLTLFFSVHIFLK